MAERGDRLFNVLMVVAVTIAAVALAQRIRPNLFGQSVQTRQPTKDPVEIKDWQSYAAVGHRMGPANAPVTILEFADFECPACRQFTTKSLSVIRSKYPNDVAVVFRHWPLAMHKFAYAAARAAECAGAQGRFEQMHDVLYAKQDSLGLKPFAEYAQESGVPDLKAFETCDASKAPLVAVDADSAAARKIGSNGTPTIVINGLRLPGGVSSEKLDSLVQVALQSRK